jgi:NDP-sugar pyrophosphorylase family protein
VPKPLVNIRGRPFLDYLLQEICRLGMRDVVLLTGYKHEMIEGYCGNGKKWGLKIRYSVEGEPLGTGGAILAASKLIKSTALVLNGDTYLDLDTGSFLEFHKAKRALATLFVMEGELEARGAVSVDRTGRVLAFLEKQKTGLGLFNSGAYLIEPAALSSLKKLAAAGLLGQAFSMEKDAFPYFVGEKALYAYAGSGSFLDIGTFAALEKAGEILH